MPESLEPDQIQLRQGASSHLRAEIWCRITGNEFELPPGATLEGPFSERGRTLTSRFTFVLIKQDAYTTTWRAILPEPVFWTPRMPAYYELRGVPGVRKRIGLRELFVRRNSFFQEDRRWVPRASFAMENPLHSESNRWTDADLVPIISPRNLNLANDAMAQGVPLIVDLSEDCVPSKLLTCIPYASITLLVLPSLTAEMIPAVQSAMSCHLPIGVHVTESGEIPEQAQFVVVSEDLLVRGWQTSRRLPVVVTREWSIEGRSPAELRAACDQFQAELEHGADYAGLWLYPKTVP